MNEEVKVERLQEYDDEDARQLSIIRNITVGQREGTTIFRLTLMDDN